ncbi:methionine--tRNA ligase [candidate division WWE3 bacterium]|nr:methionine--tRNA ligase [candidate division WWE3 bacterium]
MNKVFIGVAWPYVNGDLHVGHYAGYLLPADISARYHRLRGREVLMVSGSDCFGTPITVEADKKGLHPKEIVDEYHKKDLELFELLGISYDLYTKTDTQNHKKVTHDVFLKLLEEGYVFTDFSNQYYSEKEKRFLPDRYVEGKCPNCGFEGARSDQCDNCGALLDQGELINPVSKNTKSPVSLKKSEHYFLDWSKLQGFLEKYVSMSSGWRSWVLNETKGWLRTGLKPRAITRDLDWGIELPVDFIPSDKKISNIENKRIYVWFEAVIGYLSASIEWSNQTGKDWKPFWYDEDSYHYYFMGKDNLVFHCLFWPGQLHVYDEKLHLPDIPAINQFLNLEGRKFSKSRGVVVDTKEIVEKYGNDPVRFYLCLIMPENDDASFTWEDFVEKINNVLIGNFGNLISRVGALAKTVDVSSAESSALKPVVREKVEQVFTDAYGFLDSCRFKDYLNSVLGLSALGNSFMSDTEPWKLRDEDPEEFDIVMQNLLFILIALNYLVTPLLPETSRKIADEFGLKEVSSFPPPEKVTEVLIEKVKEVRIDGILAPLFNKLEKPTASDELD